MDEVCTFGSIAISLLQVRDFLSDFFAAFQTLYKLSIFFQSKKE
jgi:hypothetical protein